MLILQAKEKSNTIISTFDSSTLGLSLTGFIQAFSGEHENCFHGRISRAHKQDVLMRDLLAIGYDDDLNLIGSRGVVMSIHSEEDITCKTVAFDAKIFEEAIELPIIATGTVSQFDHVKLYTKENGYAGCSFVVKNELCDASVRFTMDVSGKNIMSHRGFLKATIDVPPNEAKVIHHLMPESDSGAWSYKCAMSYASI